MGEVHARIWIVVLALHPLDERGDGAFRTADANERIDLYTKMGQVYEQELRDLDRAIDAYSDVLSVEADHPAALAGLANLYEETEQWDRAVEVMRRLIAISPDPKCHLHTRFTITRVPLLGSTSTR